MSEIAMLRKLVRVQYWLGAKAVVRCDHLPPAVDVHPNVGETIVVFVRLTLLGALFVVRTSDYTRVAVRSDLKIRHFRNLDVHGRVSVVSDVSRFAESAPILNGDDEIVGQQRIHACDIASLINVIPFLLECKNFGRRTVALILSKGAIESQNYKRCEDKKRNSSFHTLISRNLSA